ncbi:MAG: A24 family peptidase [Pseudomonadota bacterium]
MFDLLSTHSGALVLAAAVLGLLIGSFLNVVIHRLPKMLEREWREQCAWLHGETQAQEAGPTPAYNLVLPPSACPHCGHRIRWFENIPVLSWLALRGRCAQCGGTISPRYPVVEALTGALFAYAAWRWGLGVETLWVWALLAILVALTFIDLDTQLLPDSLTLPLAWLGLLANLHGRFVPLEEAVLGAVIGYLSLWSVYQLFKLLTGKEGMGFGDFKLLAALGAWMGWKMLLPIVLAASLAGALIGVSLVLFRGRERSQPLPFGPWLSLGGLVCLFWGGEILQAWLG